jgi:transposase InsO family protein
MRAELTIAALIMAIQRQRPGAGLIHHSDRGSQYAAGDYRDILRAAAIVQSADSDDVAWSFRNHVARCSDMMSLA